MTSNLNISGSCGDEEKYPVLQASLRVYAILPVCIIGVLGNLINISIFAGRQMRQFKVNWFLLALAISDIVLLVSTVFMLSYPVLAEKSHSFGAIQAAHYLTRWFYPLGLTAQTASVYLVVTVCIFRYLGICWPFIAQQWGTSGNVKIALACTMFFSIVFNSSRWLTLITVDCFSTTFNRTGVYLGQSSFTLSKGYKVAYSVFAYTLVMFLLPFCTLCALNIQLVRALKQSIELRKRTATPQWERREEVSAHEPPSMRSSVQLSPVSPKNERRRKQERIDTTKEHSITHMLIAVVTLFLICNSLPFVNNILGVLSEHWGIFDQDQFRPIFSVSVEIGNLLVNTNSSAYIIIYAVFNKKFQTALWPKHFLRPRSDAKQANGEMVTLLESTSRNTNQRRRSSPRYQNIEVNRNFLIP